MPAKRDQAMLVQVARRYYLDNEDQGAISRELGISRSSVSRMLAEARSSGIVEIRIAGDVRVERNRELESQLMRAFGLSEVLVAQTSSTTSELAGVAQLGSEIFARRAPNASRIGMSWGVTLAHFVDHVNPTKLRPNVRMTPLVGGLPVVDTTPSGNTSIQELAEKCGLVADRFDAPAIVESAMTQRAMMSESSVCAALERAADVDLAFVGIGAFDVQTSKLMLEAMKLSDEELALTQAAHPVGDMLGRYFDIAGNPIEAPTTERIIGIDLATLTQVDVVVGMVAGRVKAPAVLGALRTGALDALVLDEKLGSSVLALHNQKTLHNEKTLHNQKTLHTQKN